MTLDPEPVVVVVVVVWIFVLDSDLRSTLLWKRSREMKLLLHAVKY